MVPWATLAVSQALFRTEQDAPADAQWVSQQLLGRAGMVRPVAVGIYTLAPLALSALNCIISIAREALNRLGAKRFCFPSPSRPHCGGRAAAMTPLMTPWSVVNTIPTHSPLGRQPRGGDKRRLTRRARHIKTFVLHQRW